MRRLTPLLFLLLVAAKGGKKKGEPAPEPTPAPEPAAAPAPEEAPPPPPEEPPAPKVVKNVDFSATFTFADGTTKSGKVQGLERTVDFYGDEGWTSEADKLKVQVEAAGTEKMVDWTAVKSVNVVPGKIPDDVDCTYSSDFSPWMYECTLRTTSNVVLKDGSKGLVTNRHRWRITWADGTTTELALFKYTVREQDDRDLQFGDEATENTALYTKLQQQLRTDVKAGVLKSVTIQ